MNDIGDSDSNRMSAPGTNNEIIVNRKNPYQLNLKRISTSSFPRRRLPVEHRMDDGSECVPVDQINRLQFGLTLA